MKNQRLGGWNVRARKAIRALNLSSRTKRKKHDYEGLAFRNSQLVEGYFDPETKTNHAPIEQNSAISQIAEELGISETACVKALHRAGVRHLTRK